MQHFPETLALPEGGVLQWREALQHAWTAGLAAAEHIVKARESGLLKLDTKAHSELVTSADREADRIIGRLVAERYPEHRQLTEEVSNDLDSITDLEKPVWIVDPIDGTVNYANGHHQCAVSIGFASGGSLRAGVVISPFQREAFYACEGLGAWLLSLDSHDRMVSKPLETSAISNLETALVATGFPYDRNLREASLNRLAAVLPHCGDIRRLGSAALDICWVASGRLHGYFESLKPWDYAAAHLVATEAGARCGFFAEPPTDKVELLQGDNRLYAAPGIYDELKALLENT